MISKPVGVALAVALLAVAGLQAEWIAHGVDSVFQADREAQPHPRSLSLAMLMPQDFEAGALLCAGYANSLRNGNRGRVRARCEIERAGQDTVRTEFRGRVRENVFGACAAVAPLATGDLLRCDFVFKNFARLTLGNETGADVLGVVALVAPPEFSLSGGGVEHTVEAVAGRLERGVRSGAAE